MTRHGIRVLPTYPHGGGRWTGHITDLGNTTAEQAEDIRRAMPTGAHVEVVALDDHGKALG